MNLMYGQRLKWWHWALIAAAVIFMLQQPVAAADTVTNAAHGFASASNSLGEFLAALGD